MRVEEQQMSRMKSRLVQFHGLTCDALKYKSPGCYRFERDNCLVFDMLNLWYL